jgi:hypothetical protein
MCLVSSFNTDGISTLISPPVYLENELEHAPKPVAYDFKVACFAFTQ